MRTTVSIDDDLLKEARELTGIAGTAALVNAALIALLERESARRLALLGGRDPTATAAPRRRSATA